MTLWLVRHAQALIDAGICYGRLDVPADPLATQASAEKLAAMLPPATCVIASPLQRCELLALVLKGLRPDLTYKIDPRLREIDFGRWEGLDWNAIGAAALDSWLADFAGERTGGGETVAAFMQRVAAIWDGTRRDCSAAPVLWITHAGVVKAATLLQRGVRQISDAAQWPQGALAFGDWLRFDDAAAAPRSGPAEASAE